MILGAVLFALVLGGFVFLVLPRASRARRMLSVGVYVALIGIVYAGGVELLGRPKPVGLEWRGSGEAKVLSAVPVEDVGIYLWISRADAPEPRAYALPWDLKVAQQLQDAMSEAEASGTAVQMAMRYDAGLDERAPMFYAAPQPALPEKEYEGASPVVYTQPDTAS